MEDVSMGMWVEKFNDTRPVAVVHSLKFCQFGCIEDYFTAPHYQSPRQRFACGISCRDSGGPNAATWDDVTYVFFYFLPEFVRKENEEADVRVCGADCFSSSSRWGVWIILAILCFINRESLKIGSRRVQGRIGNIIVF